MIPKNNNNAITTFAALANAIALATSKVSALSVQLAKIGAASELAASQIASLARSATQLSLGCQAVAQCYQCDRKPAPTRWQTAAIFVNVTAQTFLTGAAILAGTEILGKVLQRLLRFSWLALGKDKLMSAVRGTLSLGRVVVQSEVMSAALESVADVVAALATVEGVLLAALATGGAAVLVGTSYLLWRHRNAVVRTIRKLSSIIADETRRFIDKVTRAVGEVIAMNSQELPRRAGGEGTVPDIASSRYLVASRNGLASVVPTLASRVRPESVGFQVANAAVRTAAAAAMFMTPLLVTPASADVDSVQPRIKLAKTASVVINSSPTITINASDCEDIEQRVLEVLRKHREELYAQLCNELQRRQRTEF